MRNNMDPPFTGPALPQGEQGQPPRGLCCLGGSATAADFPTSLAGKHEGLKNDTLHGVLTDSPEKAAAMEDIREVIRR